MRLTVAVLVTLVTAAATASADPEPAISNGVTAAPTPAWALGARVGGYGFRRNEQFDPGSWTECRMDGVGVFGQRNLRGPLFLEAGLDGYGTIGKGQASDLPLDRMSALLSVAVGLRTQFTPWLRGYVQLGVGAEFTRLSVPYGDDTIHADRIFPDGYFGFGGEIRIAHGTHIGATIRLHAMANFDYDPARLMNANQWVAAPTPSQVFTATPDMASQAQFYLRREI
jgi:hypothetical protein